LQTDRESLRLYSARSRPESINRKRLNRRTDVSYFEKNYNDKPEGKIRTVFDREIQEIERNLKMISLVQPN